MAEELSPVTTHALAACPLPPPHSPPTPRIHRPDAHDFATCAERSLDADVPDPNNGLLWASVLPADAEDREALRRGDRVAQVWTEAGSASVTGGPCFAHVKHLHWGRAWEPPRRRGSAGG